MVELNPYKKVTETIGAAADSIVKFTDSIKYAASAGVAGYDYISAKRERRRLYNIYDQALFLRYISQAPITRDIDEFLEKPNPPRAQWNNFKRGIKFVIKEAKVLLDDIRKERSDFILEDAYRILMSTMAGRISILEKFSRLPPPSTDEEKESFRKLGKEYQRLLESFVQGIGALAKYLKDKE